MTKEDKIRQYIDGRGTAREAREALQLLAAPTEKDTFDRLSDEIATRADSLASWTDEAERRQLEAEARVLLRRINPPTKKSVPIHRKRLAVAASIAVLAGLSLFGLLYMHRAPSTKDIIYSQASTSYGEVKEVMLPDGTRVSLNACSSLSYPESFAGLSERAVTLHGQGFFQVNRNEEQPFVVKTSDLDVRVLGTEFDVKAYDADELVSVSVKSGKVQVDMPDVSMRLYADEQFRYNTHSKSVDKHTDKREVAAWQHGELQFDNTPIQDVAHALERTFGCTIEFAPDSDFDNKITGVHDNANLEDVLESLQYISGIQYRKEGEHYVLYQ